MPTPIDPFSNPARREAARLLELAAICRYGGSGSLFEEGYLREVEALGGDPDLVPVFAVSGDTDGDNGSPSSLGSRFVLPPLDVVGLKVRRTRGELTPEFAAYLDACDRPSLATVRGQGAKDRLRGSLAVLDGGGVLRRLVNGIEATCLPLPASRVTRLAEARAVRLDHSRLHVYNAFSGTGGEGSTAGLLATVAQRARLAPTQAFLSVVVLAPKFQDNPAEVAREQANLGATLAELAALQRPGREVRIALSDGDVIRAGRPVVDQVLVFSQGTAPGVRNAEAFLRGAGAWLARTIWMRSIRQLHYRFLIANELEA